MCWGTYLAYKQSIEDRKLYEQTLADLNNILFQCFRTPEERLPQLHEAEKYLNNTLKHVKKIHIPKFPYIEGMSRTLPFDSKLMEVLTDKLIEIKFEIQRLRESNAHES